MLACSLTWTAAQLLRGRAPACRSLQPPRQGTARSQVPGGHILCATTRTATSSTQTGRNGTCQRRARGPMCTAREKEGFCIHTAPGLAPSSPGTPGLSAPRRPQGHRSLSSSSVRQPVEASQRPASEPLIWENGHAALSAAPRGIHHQLLARSTAKPDKPESSEQRPNYGKYWMYHVRRMLQANHG